MSSLPLPPKYTKLGTAFPMSERAARVWLNSYDKWVDLWNKHEKDSKLPLGPDWEDAGTVGVHIISALGFSPRNTSGTIGIVRMKGFIVYEKGMSFIRNKSKSDAIAWAGWIIDPYKITEPFVEPMPNSLVQ